MSMRHVCVSVACHLHGTQANGCRIWDPRYKMLDAEHGGVSIPVAHVSYWRDVCSTRTHGEGTGCGPCCHGLTNWFTGTVVWQT